MHHYSEYEYHLDVIKIKSYIYFQEFYVRKIWCGIWKHEKMSHTVLLIQTSPLPQSRSWIDYETLDECLDGIYLIFIYCLVQVILSNFIVL